MIRAAIDIGTVTCRLLIADSEQGIERPLVRECRITDLGIGVSQTGLLRADAIDRVVSCIADYRDLCDALASEQGLAELPITAIATSAARDARNSDQLVCALGELGVDLHIISGALEADLSFRGASCQFPGEQLVVVDVGGGSTEVIFGTAEERIVFAHSFDIGCRRMTERFLASDPPTAEELAYAKAYLVDELHSVLGIRIEAYRIDRVVAVAGTATSVVSVNEAMEVYDSDRVNKTVVPAATLAAVLERLAALTEAQRKTVVGLEPKRAGVIVAGMLILQNVLEVLGQGSFTVSESDILQGVIQTAGEHSDIFAR